MKTFVIDIDGTLCSNTEGDYEKAIPNFEMIQKVNILQFLGHKIVLFTARGSTTGIDWRKTTETQLANWEVKYDDLIFGKPYGDFYVDDKHLTFESFLTWGNL